MLAQNFLDAEALWITEEQRTALIKTLGAFERGEIRPENFDMSEWLEERECGTVGCLGGWAEFIGRLPCFSLNAAAILNSRLANLFYPEVLEVNVCRDPENGAQALRNYLTTGEAKWWSISV